MGQLLKELWIKLNMNQYIVAKASVVHNSPRKLRLVADAVRKLSPQDAVSQLRLLPQRAAGTLLKVYQQAIGNAKNNFKVSPAELKVKSLQVEEGPRGPRKADVHSHGARFDRGVRRKRYAHVKLELVTSSK